jgi:hypothetical protein
LDTSEGAGVINACSDASTQPETFVPACALTFEVIWKGGIAAKEFGWYNKTGIAPTSADLHPLFSSISVGTKGVLAIRTDPAYLGGEIGFYLVGFKNATFYSENRWNQTSVSCPNQIHSLIWQSVKTPSAWYFGWEDLPDCGGDNDFEDAVMYVSGIYCSGGGAVCDTGQKGPCGPGHMQCSGGGLKCLADQSPGKEVCNSVDDNCDGNVDEANPDLCPTVGDICDRGVCVQPCGGGEFVCTGTEVCDRGLCVDPLCAGKTCPAGQVCKAGTCGDGCQGVTCPAGQNCYLGRCVDPCAGKVCDTGYTCQNGVCQFCACDGCPAGLTCVSNTCVDQKCASVTCPTGQHCDSATGSCVDDCLGVVCPNGEVCMNGQCPGSVVTGGTGGGTIIITDGGVIIINPGSGGTAGASTLPDGAVSTSGGTGTVVLPDGSVVPATGGSGVNTGGARATSKDEASCGCRIAGSRWAGNLAAVAALGMLVGLRLRRRSRLLRNRNNS